MWPGSEFYEAFSVLDTKDYPYAAQLFQKLIADSPDTQIGHLAQFYLATCYLEQNQLDQARAAFASFVTTPGDPLFTWLATMNLGVIYALGRFAEAQSAYAQAAAVPGRNSGMRRSPEWPGCWPVKAIQRPSTPIAPSWTTTRTPLNGSRRWKRWPNWSAG